MSDLRQIVDALQGVLYSISAVDTIVVDRLAADYHEACDEASKRLWKCGDLLSRGLRSEAIQQADLEPRILDVVAILDFPELPQWIDALGQHGIVAPPVLQLEIAADLNEAYAAERPLEARLKMHRLLALARAPLPARIHNLRNLMTRDPTNSAWREDLLALEQFRHRQIEREAAKANVAGDLAGLEELKEEAESPAWAMPPRSEIVKAVDRAYQEVRTRNALAQLEQLEPQLNAAHMEFDVATGRLLRDSWNDFIAVIDNGQADDFAERVAPTLEWLAEQDARETSEQEHGRDVALLEKALDDGSEQIDLERLYETVRRHDRGIPEVPNRRYHARIQSHESSRRRRSLGMMLISLLGIVGITVLVGGFLVYRAHRKDVAQHTQAIESLVKVGQLEEARQYIAQLNENAPRLSTAAEVQQLRIAVDDKIEAEERRVADLQEFMTAAANLIESSSAIEPVLRDEQSHRDAERALAQASELAIAASEKAQIVTLQKEVDDLRRISQRSRDQLFREGISTVRDRIQQLEKNILANRSDVAAEISGIRELLEDLESRRRGISSSLYSQAELLTDRLGLLTQEAETRFRVADLVAEIALATGERSLFANALKDYANAFPENPRSEDFLRAIDEAHVWEAVDKWNRLADRWKPLRLDSLGYHDATEAFEAYHDYIDNYQVIADIDRLDDIVAYLEAVQHRGAPGQTLTDDLRSYFSRDWVQDWNMIETENGKRYYSTKDIDRQGLDLPSVTFRPLISYSEEQGPVTLRRVDISYLGAASYRGIANFVLENVDNINDENWDSAFIQFIDRIRSEEGVDAIVKLIFLNQVLRVGCEGSWSLDFACGDLRERLQSSDLDLTVNWMDSSDLDANRMRSLATNQLDRMRTAEQMHQTRNYALSQVQNTSVTTYEWIGWLGRDKSSNWHIYNSIEIGNAATLVVIVEDPAIENRLTAIEVGHVIDGEPAADHLSGSSAAVEGRPVYAERHSIVCTEADE